MENTAYLAYVNLAGVQDGLQFWGEVDWLAQLEMFLPRQSMTKKILLFVK